MRREGLWPDAGCDRCPERDSFLFPNRALPFDRHANGSVSLRGFAVLEDHSYRLHVALSKGNTLTVCTCCSCGKAHATCRILATMPATHSVTNTGGGVDDDNSLRGTVWIVWATEETTSRCRFQSSNGGPRERNACNTARRHHCVTSTCGMSDSYASRVRIDTLFSVLVAGYLGANNIFRAAR